MKIVFIHIPKAAGTSLKRAISDRVGTDSIYFDYNRPFAKGGLQRKAHCLLSSTRRKPREEIIFGHFLVGKYAKFNGCCFQRHKKVSYVVFLREPLQRAISHYCFWKRATVEGHPIWERFTRENWSLEEFLLFKKHTNFQSNYLWRFPLSQFDVIGLTEYFDASLKILGDAIPVLKDLPINADNSNPKNVIGKSYSIDPCLASEFVRRNKQDYALYEQAVRLFTAQKSGLLKQAHDYD